MSVASPPPRDGMLVLRRVSLRIKFSGNLTVCQRIEEHKGSAIGKHVMGGTQGTYLVVSRSYGSTRANLTA